MRVLKDQNLLTSPINTAFSYAWTALSGSWKNSVLVALALLILTLLSIFPFVGLVASVVQGILLYALAFWCADLLRESENLTAFRERVASEKIGTLLFGHLTPAAGFYTGFLIFSFLMLLATLLVLWATGGFAVIAAIQQAGPQNDPRQAAELYAQLIGAGAPTLLFVLLSSLFFSYVWPLVYGYALLQRGFGDALRAFFMLFSPRFWRASFRGAYFRTVSLWMLVTFAAAVIMTICFSLLFLLPLGILILLWMVYFTAVVSVETYNMSEEI